MQLGKLSIMIPVHKAVPFNMRAWWCAPYSHPYDIHMCAYASLLKVVRACVAACGVRVCAISLVLVFFL